MTDPQTPPEANPQVAPESVAQAPLNPPASATSSATITLDEDYSEPVSAWRDDEVTVAMPSDTAVRVSEKLEATPNIDLTDNPHSRKWANVISDGLRYTTFAGVLNDTFLQPNAQFKQYLDYNGQRYQAQAPRTKAVENEHLKGESAVLRVIKQLGLGTTFQVPLWHSGFWVTLKPPTDAEIIELNRYLIAEKIRMGRHTYGLIYSNTLVYTIDALADFIIAHVYNTTVKNEELPLTELKKHISVQDLFTLVWGFACTMYPRGFQYQRACLNDPEKCTHVLEERLNLSKLLWVNNRALNDWQKAHMASRQPFQKDLASVKRYRDELLSLKPRQVVIEKDTTGAQIRFNLRSPMLADYIEEGQRWIGALTDRLNRSVTDTDDVNERNLIIQRFAQATSMRQYVHWIDSIELDTNVIDDRETIEQTLDMISADDTIRDEFIEAVVKYINDSTIALVGIPTYNCPKCDLEQKGATINEAFTNVIALDTVQLFFDLTTQRIQRLAQR